MIRTLFDIGRGSTAMAVLVCGLSGPAAAVSDPIGVWTVSAPGTPRQCRVQFRADAAATGQAIALPPGCRRAFPILGAVRSWSIPDGAHLALNDEVGANVLMFDEAGDGRLQAAGPEGENTYVLTPLSARRDIGTVPSPLPQPAAAAVPTADVAALPAPAPAPVRRGVTTAAVAGHYAVMRGSRDTGCMVTLEEGTRVAQASLKARLAPACRDQGIIVFDPIGWSLKGDHLVLAARKGHTAVFSADETGTWVKDAQTGQPLGLKRL